MKAYEGTTPIYDSTYPRSVETVFFRILLAIPTSCSLMCDFRLGLLLFIMAVSPVLQAWPRIPGTAVTPVARLSPRLVRTMILAEDQRSSH